MGKLTVDFAIWYMVGLLFLLVSILLGELSFWWMIPLTLGGAIASFLLGINTLFVEL